MDLKTKQKKEPASAPLNTAHLLEQVKNELSSPKSKLQFAPEIEARYEADTRDATNRYFVIAGIIAVVSSNSFLLSDFLSRPEILMKIVWARLLITTLPCLAIVLIVARGVHSDLRERLTILGIWAVSLATGLINHWTTSDFASYDIFIFSLITVTANVLLPIRFKTALIASTGALVIMQTIVMFHSYISLDVKLLSFMIFTSATIFTLFSRYQLDIAQRINYLNVLRSELQNSLVLSDNAELQEISNTDALTGLANRRRFQTVFEQLVENMRQKHGKPLGILMIDIDHFKAYNDHFGHIEGDKCLMKVASAINRSLRSNSDLAARLGGEEFAVVLPEIDLAELRHAAERIRKSVADMCILHDRNEGRQHVSVSVGYTLTSNALNETLEEVITRADDALYQAKKSGRNRLEGNLLQRVI